MTDTVTEILRALRARKMTPADVVARSYERIRAYGDDAIFISLRDESKVIAEAKALTSEGHSDRPLYGIPVAVKDNIDVKGLPTTAACPAFSYNPKRDATVVERLKSAGAIIIGKTNLDQFATGLVGMRSPYGIPRNPHNPKLIPGGSSSGSAVAVAAGLVPLALGTDTAGSGRIPAGMNNIVGLKPSLGLVSNFGVVPACHTLDCISVFALNTDDAWTALLAIAGVDAADPYTRAMPLGTPGEPPPDVRLAVPRASHRIFFGDKRAKASFDAAIQRAASLGIEIVEIDFEAFLETAKALYEGPWVAERYAAVGEFIDKNPKKVNPITRKIITGAKKSSAVEAFRAFYRLAEMRTKAKSILSRVDALMVPTVPTAFTIAEIKRDPVGLNSKLGTYTNFVNLLDLAGLAIPAEIAADGTPFGVTFLGLSGHDALIASIGRRFHADTALPLGALNLPQPSLSELPAVPGVDEIALAVVGAHLSGMPLNGELKNLGARFLEVAATAPDYRLFTLNNTTPHKPGLLRVAKSTGSAIEIEIWALPVEAFGQFVAAVPPPLSIGTLTLTDGRSVKGFLVEAEAVAGAHEISNFGGWRAFMAKEKLRA